MSPSLEKPSSTRELFDAIAEGNVERVRWAVAEGASPDAAHTYTVEERFDEPVEVTEKALFAALNWKQEAVAIELLRLGASVDDGEDGSPLAVAIERGFVSTVRAILNRSPSQATLDAGLLAAATAGKSELGEQILAAGAEPKVPALVLACSRGAEALALSLLDRGLDVNAQERDASPLIQAASSGSVSLVRALVARGADLERDGGGALFSAANAGRVDVATALLEYGVPPDQPDGYGWTALMAAAWQDQVDVARLLLQAGANPAHHDRSGKSVLAWARESGKRLSVALLEGWPSPSV